MLKRLFDIFLSLCALIVFGPVILILALLIKLSDGGTAFYLGKRVGRFGKTFKIIKFRTMVVNADKIGGPSTAGDDPRITGIGKFIRRYKFDELPQLINVLKGDMSFVGPRPEVRMYTDLYTEEEKALLELRPGVTDWASIWNNDEAAILAGHADPEKAYLELIRPKKIRLQLKYYHERSFLTDIRIIWQTIKTLFSTRAGRPTTES